MIGAGAFGSFSMFSNTLAAEELIETTDINLVSHKLEQKYQIHHTKTSLEGVKGIRISPNIYTSLDDFERSLLKNKLKSHSRKSGLKYI